MDCYRQQLPKGVEKPQTAVHFHQTYNIPILEGDDDLIQPMLAHLKECLTHQKLKATVEGSEPLRVIGDDDLVYGVGLMLFRLVVLRVYMDRSPSDDDEIYRLVIAAVEEEGALKAARQAEDEQKALEHTEKQKRFDGLTDREAAELIVAERLEGKPVTWSITSFLSDIPIQATTRIVRRLTHPEQALAALMGWHDTTSHDDPQSIYPLHYSSVTQKGLIQVKEDLETTYDAPLAYVITSSSPMPYTWPKSNSGGLTGGPPYVPPAPVHGKAVELASILSAPRARPRPRPVTRSALRAATVTSEEAAAVPVATHKRKRKTEVVDIKAPKRLSKRVKRR